MSSFALKIIIKLYHVRGKLFLGEFFGEIIEKHKRDLDPQHPKDFIDVYLLEAEKNGEVVLKYSVRPLLQNHQFHPNQVYNSDELMNCIWDFLNAGTETSSTTLKWALLYLTIHQVLKTSCKQNKLANS